MIRRPPSSPPFPYTPLFRSRVVPAARVEPVAHVLLVERGLRVSRLVAVERPEARGIGRQDLVRQHDLSVADRKSTRLNSSHLVISYAVFCLKKKIVA